jgi:hypothetical protein
MLHMPSRSDIGSCLASGDATQAGLPNIYERAAVKVQ